MSSQPSSKLGPGTVRRIGLLDADLALLGRSYRRRDDSRRARTDPLRTLLDGGDDRYRRKTCDTRLAFHFLSGEQQTTAGLPRAVSRSGIAMGFSGTVGLPHYLWLRVITSLFSSAAV